MDPLPHLGDIVAIGAELEARMAAGGECHLYLTDYHALYVAQVGAISVAPHIRDDPQAPDYYRQQGHECDCWFQLWDIRRLVEGDTLEVQHELRALRNVRYHDRPVSLYGGIVEPPLIVTREDGARFFDQAEQDALTDGRLWIEADAERGTLAKAMTHDRERMEWLVKWRGTWFAQELPVVVGCDGVLGRMVG